MDHVYSTTTKHEKRKHLQQNRLADSVIFRKYMASFSVKCSRQSDRQLRDMDF